MNPISIEKREEASLDTLVGDIVPGLVQCDGAGHALDDLSLQFQCSSAASLPSTPASPFHFQLKDAANQKEAFDAPCDEIPFAGSYFGPRARFLPRFDVAAMSHSFPPLCLACADTRHAPMCKEHIGSYFELFRHLDEQTTGSTSHNERAVPVMLSPESFVAPLLATSAIAASIAVSPFTNRAQAINFPTAPEAEAIAAEEPTRPAAAAVAAVAAVASEAVPLPSIVEAQAVSPIAEPEAAEAAEPTRLLVRSTSISAVSAAPESGCPTMILTHACRKRPASPELAEVLAVDSVREVAIKVSRRVLRSAVKSDKENAPTHTHDSQQQRQSHNKRQKIVHASSGNASTGADVQFRVAIIAAQATAPATSCSQAQQEAMLKVYRRLQDQHHAAVVL